MDSNNLNDPKNIAGLSNLMLDDDVESNIDLAELEREIASGASVINTNQVNIAEDYRKEMERLSRNFDIGINMNDPSTYLSNDNIDIDDEPRENTILESTTSSSYFESHG